MKKGLSFTVGWSEKVLSFVASASLFSMMLLIFIDVVGRYFFSSPLMGGMEIVEVLLALTVFAGLPLTALQQQHVEIDVLAGLLPTWFWRLLGHVGNFLFALTLACIGYLLVHRAQQLANYGETTALLNFPLFFIAWGMAILCFVAAVFHLVRLVLPLNIGAGSESTSKPHEFTQEKR